MLIDTARLSEVMDNILNASKTEAWSDDPEFMVDDYAGGNVDDAYYGGMRDGRVQFARELMIMLKGSASDGQ